MKKSRLNIHTKPVYKKQTAKKQKKDKKLFFKNKVSLISKRKTSLTFRKQKAEKDLLNKLKLKFSGKIFTLKQARKYKASSQLLSYYVKQDRLKRISQGVYAFKNSLGFDFYSVLKEKLICVPQAVVGLESALKIYGLTDESPDAIHLIVPLSNVPKRKLQDVEFYQMKDSLYKKHIKVIKSVPVSSFERTIIDLFRFGYSTAFVLSVIKEGQTKKLSFNLGKVKKMATPYRVKGKVCRLLEVL